MIGARDEHRTAALFLADILGLHVGTATPPFSRSKPTAVSPSTS
jgi:hypothetical protein